MISSTGALAATMIAAGLLPFALVMLTSFVKMAVVLSIVRSAIGTPQIPPNSVVTGLALVLSFVVMAPVAYQAGERLQAGQADLESGSLVRMGKAIANASQPLHEFLARHALPEQVEAFSELLGGDGQADGPSWKVLVPAFVISQLHQAFKIGFVIFLPFLVLDMLVASVLLSLGMHMLSPTTISLPFKLLLFVFADGWTLIGTSLLGSYC